jgi:hypothetical protein
MEKKNIWIIVIVALVIVVLCCCAVLVASIGAFTIFQSQTSTSSTVETLEPVQVPTGEPLQLPTIDLNQGEDNQNDQNESNIDSKVLSQMENIEQEVQELRGLPAATDLDRQTYTSDQLREKVMNEFFVDYTEEDVRQDTIILNLFGLIERDFDLYDMFVNLYSEQIAGFYDDDTKEMVVVQGEDFAGPEKMTYAHEYTHALQDATYDLNDGLMLDDDTCDLDSEYCAAVTALVEGDASFVETQWFLDYSSLKDKQEVMQYYQEYESPVFDNTPAFLQEDLIFPYVKGLDFVTQLFEEGGFPAVDQAYLNPPVSTEQIMHPERYPDDKPVSIDLEDFTSLLGDGWEEIDRNTFGEWYTYLMFAKPLSTDWAIAEEDASAAAEGWGGDLYLVYHNQDLDQDVLVSLSEWDTQTDADEYWDTFSDYGSNRWGSADQSSSDELVWDTGSQVIVVRRQADQVLWIIAPDQGLVETVADQFPAFQ